MRELEATIENIIVLATGSKITLADLPANIAGSIASPSTAIVPASFAGTTQSNALLSLAGMNLAELEKQAIEKTLEMVQGNREQAAKILGIGERTLYRKIKEYGLKE